MMVASWDDPTGCGGITTQAKNLSALETNLWEAIELHFEPADLPELVNLSQRLTMDWSDCDLVESVPGKVSGVPVIKGTRIFADTIPQDYELGASVEEIHESYPSVSIEQIKALIEYQFAHKPQLQL